MSFEIDEKKYNIIVNKKKIKHAYIKVDEEINIVININKYVTTEDIKKMINSNRSSIIKMIKKRELQNEKNEEFYFLGEKYDLILTNQFFLFDSDNKKIYYKEASELDRFLKNQTKEVLTKRYNDIYQRLEFSLVFPKLKFRKMKTRWGVCNRKTHAITLNTELIKKSVLEIDYVIYHEFCHFEVFDHSKNFWNLVSYYVPNYKELRKSLKE